MGQLSPLWKAATYHRTKWERRFLLGPPGTPRPKQWATVMDHAVWVFGRVLHWSLRKYYKTAEDDPT